MLFQMNSDTQVQIVHIRVRYPTDMRASSQSIFGMLNGFTLDPGISDQLTDISIIGMPNHLHRNTNSTSKHHLQKVHNASQFPQQVRRIKEQSPQRWVPLTNLQIRQQKDNVEEAKESSILFNEKSRHDLIAKCPQRKLNINAVTSLNGRF
jgi:hypothetical protein